MMMKRFPRRRRGMALPIMLIILVVMLVGSVYMLRAVNGSTLVTSSLAYDSQLSKAVDLGLLAGASWLSAIGKTQERIALEKNLASEGYVASYDPTQSLASAAFWSGSAKLTDSVGNKIEYVIHRMCRQIGPYDAAANACVVSLSEAPTDAETAGAGNSISTDGFVPDSVPSVHYVVTARIFGARGGNVVNQTVVMVGG